MITAHSRITEHRRVRTAVLGPLCAAVVATALVLGGCSSAPRAESAPSEPAVPEPTRTPAAPEPPPTAAIVEALAPASVRIPAIELDEPLIDLGITAEGDMEVPEDFDEVGWFTGGGRPGGRGPTVIAAHVDSPTGPAVFLRLEQLVPGDTVEVTDTAGSTFSYVVTEVADYPKSAFPTSRVFGAVADDQLRLITCGGVFDTAAASYVDNRVVYAERTG
ncbi:LPXTG-site transpeptidase (sortase) family protein [Microbacterium sp. AG1240]|uniref:class F sortase n=1 Tax=Microbacterium sp. AG1240 TaxID=2183992 RepID=UPI000F0DDEC9|nr:class F sortase [Microbacterium sp. AG1240]RKT36664.1 LPXTG-site transpeptidase (sortase) family protein [Microbacterium sp. AG1240]